MNKHAVRVAVVLEPVGTPMVRISCGGETKTARLFNKQSWFMFAFEQSAGPAQLSVEMFGKQPDDSTTAVIVKTVKLNDIEHMQNTYQGIYYPYDMEPRRDNYIAWNGVWKLDFTVPVFTWMHKTQNLGWIYD